LNAFKDVSVDVFVEVLVDLFEDVLLDSFARLLRRFDELSLEEFVELLLDAFDELLSTRCSGIRSFSTTGSPGPDAWAGKVAVSAAATKADKVAVFKGSLPSQTRAMPPSCDSKARRIPAVPPCHGLALSVGKAAHPDKGSFGDSGGQSAPRGGC
jgi:hypothetical protein